MKRITPLIFAIATVTSLPAQSEKFWSSVSLSYLKNTSDFKVLENDNINVFTFEHGSGHSWGDTFFFADRISASADKHNEEHKETYGEFSPRLSLSNLTNKKLAFGPVKDVLLASTFEHSSISKGGKGSGFNNYLFGIGLSWDLPHFTFLNTNIYKANNDKVDNDYQLTVNFGLPFSISEQNFIIDGYLDWSSAADDHHADFHFNPQIRWDVGNNFGHERFVEIGVEYSYWRNKFGIENIDNESVISAMIKVYL